MSYHNKFSLNACVRQIQIEQLIDKDEDKIWVNAVNAQGETPVHIAAKNINLQLLESLLPYFTNIEITDNQGNTVLHVLADVEASKYKDIKKNCNTLFRALLSKGADINKQNKHGWTPIHYAAKNCHIDMLKIAKSFNANFNLETFDGETPLLLVCKDKSETKVSLEDNEISHFIKSSSCDISTIDDETHSTFYHAVKQCSVSVIKVHSENGADVRVCTKYHKFTPLLFAIKNRNLTLLKILLGHDTITQHAEELTPIQISLIDSFTDVVKYLITNGANLNCRDKVLKLTPLHLTICLQSHDLFKFLIEKGANVNLPDEDGLTPLHLSSLLGCFDFTKILLENGAEVNCRSINGFTPLHLVTMQSHLEENSKPEIICDVLKRAYEKYLVATSLKYPDNSIEQDYESIIHLLLCHGADVNSLTSSGWSSLLFATELERNTDNFMKILVENGADVNYAKPSSGFTALHFASKNNSDTKVEVLINAGADVNALSLDGRTPLHVAVKMVGGKALTMLLKYGASVDGKATESRLTPLHLALEKKYEYAAIILITAGADVHRDTPDGKSPVCLAVQSNCMGAFKLLIVHGADVNYKQPLSQLTALHVALKKNDENAVAMLIDAGADVNALTGDGKSPIHLAIESLRFKSHVCKADHKDIVRILIEKGADVNVLVPNGTNTLHFALKSSCKQLLKSLLQGRVKLNCRRRRCLYSLLYVTAQSDDENVIDELDDSDKTPLISVAMNVKNPDIKRAIYCLSALVDAPNIRSCMYLNFDVNNCCNENLAHLRTCGEYFYNTEAYNKFVTYRVLSGDFHKFSDRPVIDAMHYKDIFFCKYLFMLDAVNLPLTTKSKKPKPPSDDEIWDYDKKCREEVRKLQIYSISEGITLFDVLHMLPRRARLYMNNFNISDIADKFKIYHKLILTYYYKDKIRSILMETAHSAFFHLTNVNLPVVCLDEIFWKLDIMDIIATIEAVERID